MKKRFFVFLFLLIILQTKQLQAQVTIGSGEAPTYGALLDLKTQQTGNVTNVGDNANITSTNGGLLLPRVKLTTFTSLDPVVMGGDALPVGDKLKLAGLMVYNINAVAGTLYLGVYVWNGSAWAYLVDSKVSSSMSVMAQPQAFSFYEKGTETPDALVFAVNPPKAADGTIGTVSYQWYQLVGSNVHARVGQPIVGQTDASYVPEAAFNTTNGSRSTLYAQNNGLSRFYCVATGSDGSTLTSNIVEVAVGCGAKNNLGEWISFMCFNLGADKDLTIQQQKDYPVGTFTHEVSGQSPYVAGTENVWGDLYQWGRIADGHQKRNSDVKAIGDGTDLASNIGNGFYCKRNAAGGITGNPYPYQQVKPSATDWYGKFITALVDPYTWTPIAQIYADQLWRLGRFVVNDPCAKFKADGTFVEAWTTSDVPAGNYAINPNPACVESGTAWRTPVQADWSDIYRGTQIAGSPAIATANTWTWYNGTASNYSRGYEIKPDGNTTTLFLPASGYRSVNNGLLYYQGANAYYWSTTPVGNYAHSMYFYQDLLSPANINNRGYGMALRCVKN